MSALLDALGQEKLERLSASLGGTRVRVPIGLDHGKAPAAFTRRVGCEEIAVLLILHFGYSSIYVPRLTGPWNRGRLGGGERVSVKAVMGLTAKGKSANEIALKLGCSDRAVYRKRAKHRKSLSKSLSECERSAAHVR